MLEPELRRPFINVSRWLTTLINQPQFKSVLGDMGNQLCTKAVQFDANKFKEFQDSASHQQKESHAAAPAGQKEEQHGKRFILYHVRVRKCRIGHTEREFKRILVFESPWALNFLKRVSDIFAAFSSIETKCPKASVKVFT